MYLGMFPTPEEAARRWDEEARKDGRAVLNFPSAAAAADGAAAGEDDGDTAVALGDLISPEDFAA
eukprot:CAMPEP_0170150232 /NCGR_PEP_ID=MMETSP0033_2-20121228/45666_1 /TAXON_ID=195969 /ORGANISM="Dolichomastix tenuilepis, Strain CCMP3274" /LENGTH=64 /DNA_ID=CAMNT_0010387243 /DNA_START=6 /DNA_END=200 /DNA_ORIENTATION=-